MIRVHLTILYCSLTPSYYRLFWGLRAGSQAAGSFCGEALTPYIYPKNRMVESILKFFFLLCFFTVFMCVASACAHDRVCAHMYASAHTDMKAGCPWRVTPYFLRQNLSLKLELTNWWDWLDGKPQESSCLQSSLPAADITDTHCQASHVRVHWGTDACAARSLSTQQSLPSRELVYLFVCLCGNWGNRKSFHSPWISIIIFLLNINI